MTKSRKVSLVCYNVPTPAQLGGALRWAHILHDMDTMPDTGELKKPHWHVYLEYGNPRNFSAIASLYGVPSAAVCAVASVRSTLAYLTHRTGKAIADGKYIYPPESVVCSDDMDFDFSEIVTTAGVDYLAVFRAPDVESVLQALSQAGEPVTGLQQFKNALSAYQLLRAIDKDIALEKEGRKSDKS